METEAKSRSLEYNPTTEEQDVLVALAEEGRATPSMLCEATGLRKQYVNDTLNVLTQTNAVERVSRGLYEYKPEGGDNAG